MAKLWGGRFNKKSDPLADQFTFSIDYDYRLAEYDVIGSIAHAEMLGKQKIIPKKDADAIIKGLITILRQIQSGAFKYDPRAEDIHSDIQTRLKKLIGAPADKLHTARSRNDQVVLDVKLYCIDHAHQIFMSMLSLQQAIVFFAGKNKEVIIPGYTHLQSAQVVLLAHHLLAYVEMIERDKERLIDAVKRINSLPLGSCALAGTSLKTDRAYVAKVLGFAKVAQNSMDVVADRDFIVELISTCAISAMHISRIAEDLVLWSSKEFDFIDIDASFCTGSSIMPQKKNPDVAELLRGTSARIIANVTEVLVLLKGLPLTYNRDLQLDKPPLFETVETMLLAINVLAKMFETITVKKDVVARRINDEHFFCVDVMDYLIKKGVSYREAHDILGGMVRNCLDKGKSMASLSLPELKSYSSYFEADVKKLFNPEMSVKIKTSLGSTNPALVQEQLNDWQKKLKK